MRTVELSIPWSGIETMFELPMEAQELLRITTIPAGAIIDKVITDHPDYLIIHYSYTDPSDPVPTIEIGTVYDEDNWTEQELKTVVLRVPNAEN